MKIEVSLPVEELKNILIRTIYSRLKKLRRTHKSLHFQLYREYWDKICKSKVNPDDLKIRLVKEIMKIEKYNNKNFKSIFGKKRVYNPSSKKDKIIRNESWGKTRHSRNLKKDYWESRRQ